MLNMLPCSDKWLASHSKKQDETGLKLVERWSFNFLHLLRMWPAPCVFGVAPAPVIQCFDGSFLSHGKDGKRVLLNCWTCNLLWSVCSILQSISLFDAVCTDSVCSSAAPRSASTAPVTVKSLDAAHSFCQRTKWFDVWRQPKRRTCTMQSPVSRCRGQQSKPTCQVVLEIQEQEHLKMINSRLQMSTAPN